MVFGGDKFEKFGCDVGRSSENDDVGTRQNLIKGDSGKFIGVKKLNRVMIGLQNFGEGATIAAGAENGNMHKDIVA